MSSKSKKPIGGLVLFGDKRGLTLNEITAPIVHQLVNVKEIPEDYVLKLPDAEGNVKQLLFLSHVRCVEFSYDYEKEVDG